jgi:hypothetical protein
MSLGSSDWIFQSKDQGLSILRQSDRRKTLPAGMEWITWECHCCSAQNGLPRTLLRDWARMNEDRRCCGGGTCDETQRGDCHSGPERAAVRVPHKGPCIECRILAPAAVEDCLKPELAGCISRNLSCITDRLVLPKRSSGR